VAVKKKETKKDIEKKPVASAGKKVVPQSSRKAQDKVKSGTKVKAKKKSAEKVKANVKEKVWPLKKAKIQKKSGVSKKVSIPSSRTAVSKIIIGFDDEITSLLEQIDGTPSNRVAITIPSGSDLLMSSVLMKLVAQRAEDLDKNVIIVTDDKTGERMARLAGFIVRESTSEIDDGLWKKVESARKDVKEDAVQKIESDSAEKSDDDKKVLEDPKKDDDTGLDAAKPMDLGRSRDLGLDSGSPAREVDTVRKVTSGGFEMTVDSAPSGKSAGPDKPEGTEDPYRQALDPAKRSLVGRDFSGYEAVGQKSDSKYDELPQKEAADEPPRRKAKTPGAGVGIVGGVIGKVTKMFSPATLAKMSAIFTAKKIMTLLIPFVVILVAVFAFMGWYLPEVVVNIEIESIKVEYEGDSTALTSVDGINVEDLVIPAKEETVLKNGSDNGTATGVASRGEKATGTVIIFNKTTDAVTIPAGTILSNGGLNFILQGTVNLDAANPPAIPMTQANGNVVAEAVGSEYNVEGGTEFVVGSYALGEVSAANSDKFTGGSKEDYKVVSQGDIDTLADKIEKGLYEEAEEELSREAEGSRWIFVKSSVKKEIDGDVTSDVPAGAEQDSFNVSLKTRSTALYYDENALDEMIEELLLSEVDEDEDMSGLELSENLEKEVEGKSAAVDGGKIILTIEV